MSDFTWVPFYTEFADKLLAYRTSRPSMIEKVVKAYEQTGMNLPKLDSIEVPTDMDPFTVFGLFNKSMKDENRIALCKAMKELFSVGAAAPSDFDGIPVLNPLNATFYRFTGDPDRGEHDVENLWVCFAAAMAYADHSDENTRQNFIQAYDAVKDLKGNRWKLTMGLYWIRPHTYLSLDSRNRWFLTGSGRQDDASADAIKALKEIPDGTAYLRICAQCVELIAAGGRYSSLAALSFDAWNISEEVNQKQKQDAQQSGKNATGAAQADPDQDVRPVHYWLYAPGENAAQWEDFFNQGIMAIGWSETGDARNYSSREEIKKLLSEKHAPLPMINPSLAVWQMLHDMKVGDVIFAKQGRHKIIGRGVVTSDYDFVEDYPIEDYCHQRQVKWTHKGEWAYPKDNAPMKTLTDMTAYTGIVDSLNDLFADESDAEDTPDTVEPEIAYPAYTPEDFLSDVFMSSEDYTTLVQLLRKKKNVILQGAPGVGKTYAAKRLAYSMMGVKDQERVAMVQFHQSYSYEDFIMGFRPCSNGFELRQGAFYTFCKKAQDDPDNEYFFIIDEINRGNLSKIFGELFMLIESDKRGGMGLQLLYADERFSVPVNVLIIGMMNTADRSLAMMDYALRRRFAFFDMAPGFATEGFRKYQESLHSDRFDRLIACIESLNQVISEDESLGDGFRIGHSYFCNLTPETLTGSDLTGIVRFELAPLLREYWFDEPRKVKDWTARLEGAVK